MHLQSCFNTKQEAGGLLFPGSGQDARFSVILAKVLWSKKREVELMGFNVDDLGTHSIRKGAVSYLASLPGGLPAASTCIRAGWTIFSLILKNSQIRYIPVLEYILARTKKLWATDAEMTLMLERATISTKQKQKETTTTRKRGNKNNKHKYVITYMDYFYCCYYCCNYCCNYCCYYC
jgi:hypothetical protein